MMVGMRKPRHDPTEIRRLLEARQAELLTFKQLSERSGVPVHVLTYRADQDRRAVSTLERDAVGFVEVVQAPAAPQAEAIAVSSGIELTLPGGLRVALAPDFDEATLTRVLAIARC